MSERENGLVDIYANIFVEHDSQKGIIIGKNGGTLKQIGTLSRQSIEELLGKRVNLQLWVKHRERWRNNAGKLRELELI